MTIHDRTVHGLTEDGREIVRYERAGKWYVEGLVERARLTLQGAVDLACGPGAVSTPGLPGGGAFDQEVTAYLEAEASRDLPQGVTDHGRAANGLRVRSRVNHTWGGRVYVLVDLEKRREIPGGYGHVAAARDAARRLLCPECREPFLEDCSGVGIAHEHRGSMRVVEGSR